MDIRKYEAPNMSDAVKLIKKELGKDAVILSTQEREKSIPGSALKTKYVEVVAAAAAAKELGKPKGHSQETDKGKAMPVVFPRLEKEPEMRIIRGSPTMATIKQTRPEMPKGKATSIAAALGTAANQPTNITIMPKHPQSMVAEEAVQSTNREVSLLREELGKVRKEMEALPTATLSSEMQEIKVMLHDLLKQKYASETKKYPDYLTNIAVKMRAAGVVESLLIELLDTVNGLPISNNSENIQHSPEKLKEFYLNNFIRLIFRHLNVTGSFFKSTDGHQKIHCFVGPTGVGKTTTISKLAANLKITKKQKVALLSMDSMRIAASEQLRTYAKILDAPFAEINEPAEALEFLQKHREFDTIFIDTAGRTARDSSNMDMLKALAGLEAPIHFHLVLSSTMKQRDLDEVVRAFKVLNLESLLFTKLDESWNFGEILNTAVRTRIPLSYFCIGQKVPEDIEIATKEKIVEKLFAL